MVNSNIIDELSSIVCKVLGKDSLILRREMTANDIEGWDSLSHVKILYQCEMKWGIKLTYQQLTNLKCIGDLVDIIEEFEGN